MTKPEIFETAFLQGAKIQTEDTELIFYPFNIGNIAIECGKIIACDPILINDAKPFVQVFPIGNYPVQLSIGRIDGDERVAFSRILFSTNLVEKWEFALQEGQQQATIFEEAIYGYSVDAAMALFIDEKAIDDLKLIAKKDESIWEDIFVKQIMKNYRPTWTHLLYTFNSHNLACFSTGYGDGFYATYIGYDDKGVICRLLTDFALVDWWEDSSK